jgi:hypothetical protein
MPSDCLLEIFSYITNPDDLVSVIKVCKRFSKIASNETIHSHMTDFLRG